MALENQVQKNPLNTPEQNAPTDPFVDSFSANNVKDTTETPVSMDTVNDTNPQIKWVKFSRGIDWSPQTEPLPSQPKSPETPPTVVDAKIWQNINTVSGIPEDIRLGQDIQAAPDRKKFKPFSPEELTQAAKAWEDARSRGVSQEDINKQLSESEEFQGRKRATELERRGMRRELVWEIGEFVQQNPQLLSDREAFNEMIGFDELPDFQQRIANMQFETMNKEANNPESLFTGLLNGIDQNLDTPAYWQAKKRFATFQGMSTLPPSQIASAVTSWSLLLGTQKMNDLQRYNPELFEEVNRNIQEQENMKFINNLWSNLYNNLTKSAKKWDQLPKWVMDSSEFTTSTEEIKKQQKEEMQLVKQVDEHVSKSIVSQLGEKAWSFLSFAAEQLNNPEILAQKETVNNAASEVEKLQDQMSDIADAVRSSVPDTAPEALIQAMISEKTKNIQTKLRTASNLARTEQAFLTSLVEQSTQNIGLVQTALWMQTQEEAAFAQRQQQEFNNRLALEKFSLDKQQFNFWLQQAAWSAEARAQQEAIAQRIDLAKLTPEQRAFAMWQTSNPEQQKPNFWSNAKTTNEDSLNNDTDRDLDLQKGDVIPSPINGTVELLQEQWEPFFNSATGEYTTNIQLRIRAEDWSLVTFNHLDPNMLKNGLLVDWQKITAGQPLFEWGNTWYVIPWEGWDGSHVDVRVIQNGRSLNGAEVRDYLKWSFESSLPQTPKPATATDIVALTLATFGSKASDGERKAIEAVLADNPGITPQEAMQKILLFSPTQNQELGNTLLNTLRQSQRLSDFDTAWLSDLLSKWKVTEAIKKTENSVYKIARQELGGDFISEAKTKTAVARSNELLDIINELWKDAPIWNFWWSLESYLGRFKSWNAATISNKAQRLVAEMRNDLLWSNVTAAEKAVLSDIIPELWDSAKNFKIKIEALRNEPLRELNNQREVFGLPPLTSQAILWLTERSLLYSDQAWTTSDFDQAVNEFNY